MRLPHEVLGVSERASKDEIRQAYRRAAMRVHPDRGGTVEQFNELRTAYKKLSAKCSTCGNRGFVKQRRGAFVDKVPCPHCWRKV